MVKRLDIIKTELKKLEIELERIERFRIDHDDFSTLYYPSENLMSIECFDTEEDDEIEITVWSDGEFLNDEVDRVQLEKDLDFFKENI